MAHRGHTTPFTSRRAADHEAQFVKLNLLKSDHLKLELLKLNPLGSLPKQDPVGGDLAAYDESILQQSRFWMRTVTWTMIGTTVFGVAWLALARRGDRCGSWSVGANWLGAGHPDACGGCGGSNSRS